MSRKSHSPTSPTTLHEVLVESLADELFQRMPLSDLSEPRKNEVRQVVRSFLAREPEVPVDLGEAVRRFLPRLITEVGVKEFPDPLYISPAGRDPIR